MRVYKRKRKAGGKVREDEKYSVEFRDHLDTVRRLVAFTDRQQSKALAERIEKLITWRKLGGTPDVTLQNWMAVLNAELLAKLAEWALVPEELLSRDKPLVDRLEAFIKNLTAQKKSQDHCSLLKTRIGRILDDCKFSFARDINEEAIQNKLGQWQTAGMSQQTVNHYVRAIKQFTKWMKRHKYIPENPIEELAGGNPAADRRLERRELTGAEITLLLLTTRARPVRSNLTGDQRAMLYTVALGTGLRAKECASLTARSFDLNSDPCTVNIGASDEKARRGADLPIPAHLVAKLREWLPTCAAGPLWPGKWAAYKQAGKFMKADLEATRKAWLLEAEGHPEELARRTESDFLLEFDHDGKVADFHSLRHTYLSRLGRSGAPAKVMQMLARHSTVELTLTRYTHANLVDLAGAVAKLPALEESAEQVPEVLRATGTDLRTITEKQNSDTKKSGPLYGPFLGTSGVISGHSEAFSEGEDGHPFHRPKNEKTPGKHGVSEGFRAERQGFEPWVGLHLLRFSRPVQSAALPSLLSAESVGFQLKRLQTIR